MAVKGHRHRWGQQAWMRGGAGPLTLAAAAMVTCLEWLVGGVVVGSVGV